MRKRNWRDIAFGMVLMVLISAMVVPALGAAMATTQIEVLSGGIQLVVDGLKVTPKDAKGNEVQPFVYKGTTFVPLRAIGEALGKTVRWDGATSTVYVGESAVGAGKLWDLCPAYKMGVFEYVDGAKGEYVTMNGTKYTDGIWTAEDLDAYALFNTNGNYSKMSFVVGHQDSSSMGSGKIDIYLDGVFSQTIEVDGEMIAKEVEIPLKNALQVKIEYTYTRFDGDGRFALMNATIE